MSTVWAILYLTQSGAYSIDFSRANKSFRDKKMIEDDEYKNVILGGNTLFGGGYGIDDATRLL